LIANAITDEGIYIDSAASNNAILGNSIYNNFNIGTVVSQRFS
jgi:parallel beta-helix repeat protein